MATTRTSQRRDGATSRRHGRPSAREAARRRRTARLRRWTLAAAVTVAVVGGIAVVAEGRSGGDGAGTGAVRALEPTGERNQMGLPVLTTPGTGSGTAAAGGVEVDGATWALGRVPLDVAVRPAWTLRNTGAGPVTLGEPKPEVRKGCCPGPLALGTRTLAPGASTTLTFELAMHQGMDGWHDIAVHVPVGSQTLDLAVTGDFRG